ncbi:hypothetical protein CAAR111675_02250 [Campylobacter armoricus]
MLVWDGLYNYYHGFLIKMKNLSTFVSINNSDKIYIKPNIPKPKLFNAINSYALGIDPNEVEILIDETLFGSSKNGAIITQVYFICKEDFEDIYSIELQNLQSFKIKKGLTGNKLYINEKYIMTFTQASFNELENIFKNIKLYLNQKDFIDISTKSNQNLCIFKNISRNNLENIFKIHNSLLVKGLKYFTYDESNNISDLISKYYINSFTYIQKKYINNQTKEYFKNDFAYFEIITMLTILLEREIATNFNIQENNLKNIINQGLYKLMQDRKMINLININMQSYDYNIYNIIECFSIKMFLNNFYEKIIFPQEIEQHLQNEKLLIFLQKLFNDNFDIENSFDTLFEKLLKIFTPWIQDVELKFFVENTASNIIDKLI